MWLCFVGVIVLEWSNGVKFFCNGLFSEGGIRGFFEWNGERGFVICVERWIFF